MADTRNYRKRKRASLRSECNFQSIACFGAETATNADGGAIGYRFNVKDDVFDSDLKDMVIRNVLNDYVNPEIRRRVGKGALAPSFKPTLVHILMNSRSHNKIFLDKETRICGNVVLKNGRNVKEYEPIKLGEIEKIDRIFPPKNYKADCAYIMLIRFRNTWLGCVDFIYNRAVIGERAKAARQFLDTAKYSLENRYWRPFVVNVWRSAELVALCLLLLHFQGPFSTRQKHEETKKRFKELCDGKAVPDGFWEHYNWAYVQYKPASYVQGSSLALDVSRAEKILETARDMVDFVDGLLEFLDKDREPPKGNIAEIRP